VETEFEDRLAEVRVALIDYLKDTGGESFADLLPEPKTGDNPGATPAVKVAGGTHVEQDTKVPGDTMVYHAEGKKRVHVEGCKRLTADLEKLTKMTWAEAQKKGLPLCSRCPGSTTPGKGNPAPAAKSK
jgi:hypothetical protein